MPTDTQTANAPPRKSIPPHIRKRMQKEQAEKEAAERAAAEALAEKANDSSEVTIATNAATSNAENHQLNSTIEVAKPVVEENKTRYSEHPLWAQQQQAKASPPPKIPTGPRSSTTHTIATGHKIPTGPRSMQVKHQTTRQSLSRSSAHPTDKLSNTKTTPDDSGPPHRRRGHHPVQEYQSSVNRHRTPEVVLEQGGPSKQSSNIQLTAQHAKSSSPPRQATNANTSHQTPPPQQEVKQRKSSRKPQIDADGWWIQDPEEVNKRKWTGRNGNSRWPSNKEQKAKSVSTESNAWGSDQGGAANGGVALFEQDDPNDVSYLMDYKGDWLPAPVEWYARKGYRCANPYKFVDDWRRKHTDCYDTYEAIDPNISSDELQKNPATIAPLAWMKNTVDGVSLQAYWEKLAETRPGAFWEEDMNTKPWWLCFQEKGRPFLDDLPVPDALLDPEDKSGDWGKPDTQFYLEGVYPQTTNDTVERYLNKKEKKAADAAKDRAKRKAAAEQGMYELRKQQYQEAEDKVPGVQPSINAYLRPYHATDIPQITDIYNWHRRHGPCGFEEADIPVREMVRRLDMVKDNKLPTIVAVLKKSPTKDHRNRHRPGTGMQETIIGVAYADDWVAPDTVYRHSVECEVYVHPDYLRKGIGSCLLDRLNLLLDLHYPSKGEYEWRKERLANEYEDGGQRYLAKLMINFPTMHGDAEHLGWVAAWLLKFGFKQWGFLEKNGQKFNRLLDTALFCREAATMSLIDPTRPKPVDMC